MAPQLDPALAAKLVDLSDESSVVIRIPTANSLPGTQEDLLKALGRAEGLLASRVIVETPVPAFVDSLKDQPTRDDVIREFQAKAEALRIDEAHRQLLAENLGDADKYVQAVLGDPNASVEAKFAALLVGEMVEARRLQSLDGGDEALHRMMLVTAGRLRTLVRRGPAHLKFYAVLQFKAAELDYLVHRDWGLFVNARAQGPAPDPLWAIQLEFARAHVARQIGAKHRQCVRLLKYASNSPHRWVLATPVVFVWRVLPN